MDWVLAESDTNMQAELFKHKYKTTLAYFLFGSDRKQPSFEGPLNMSEWTAGVQTQYAHFDFRKWDFLCEMTAIMFLNQTHFVKHFVEN